MFYHLVLLVRSPYNSLLLPPPLLLPLLLLLLLLLLLILCATTTHNMMITMVQWALWHGSLAMQKWPHLAFS